jgi:hypothetical protein
MHCGEFHWSSRCKSIARPPDGFSKENGGGGHGGDDEEDRVKSTKDLSSQYDAQNGSRDGGFPAKRRVQNPLIHVSPNRPSSVAV